MAFSKYLQSVMVLHSAAKKLLYISKSAEIINRISLSLSIHSQCFLYIGFDRLTMLLGIEKISFTPSVIGENQDQPPNTEVWSGALFFNIYEEGQLKVTLNSKK